MKVSFIPRILLFWKLLVSDAVEVSFIIVEVEVVSAAFVTPFSFTTPVDLDVYT